jgi:hypothetical protein
MNEGNRPENLNLKSTWEGNGYMYTKIPAG